MQTLLESAKNLTLSHLQTQYLQKIMTCSPFMARVLSQKKALLAETLSHIEQPYQTAQMQQFLKQYPIQDMAGLQKALRELRQAVLARVISRDLNRLADLHEVMQTITSLAEIAIQTALDYLYDWQGALDGYPQDLHGQAQSLSVIGMGKLGGAELNVSSDVDLIFAYAQDGETTGAKPVSNQQFFTRLAKKLIAALDEVTADGFVFRVDMRLRPFGSEGALVTSIDALEQYYQNHGREWERYAWIKGREITGNNDIASVLKPFVYRKYLDYGAFASMRELKVHIQRDVNSRTTAQVNGNDNIKLGRGGIREIEFIAQVFQLIRGGQDASLRLRPTLETLQRLSEKGLLQKLAVTQLTAAYHFLRQLEHRLMYVEDQQTQDLPTQSAAQQRLAVAMNLADWSALMTVLDQHRAVVAQQFDLIFADRQQGRVADDAIGQAKAIWEGIDEAQGQQKMTALGYQDAQASLQCVTRLHQSHRYLQLPELSRQRFNQLMPLLIRAAGATENADVALARTIDFLEAVCRRASYLALLAEYPDALHLVVRLCAASAWCAQYLTMHPIVLDEMLDEQSLFAEPDFNAMHHELSQLMQGLAGDTEQQMDSMRHFKHAAVFRFAVKDIAGQLSLKTLSDYLSALADLIIDVAMTTVWQSLKIKHRAQPAFAVIGYGKLGSRELAYASDLDIIFLYDDQADNAGEIYGRFAQRINYWFNTLTAAGLLYETDLQLRPDGNSGLLVSSTEAFREYQLARAWTWEHQAITRARYVAGSAAVGQVFADLRIEVITQAATNAALKTDVLTMREKLRASYRPHDGLFDIKHSAGGIIDVEFIVQYLILKHAKQYPVLTENIGNNALLKQLGALALIEAKLANRVADAYLELRRLQHAARLQGDMQAKVKIDLLGPHAQAVQQLWQAVFS